MDAPSSYSLQPQGPAHLCAWDGDEGHELVHVAHGQPVRVELHGCLYLLGLQEVPHHLGHPPTARPGAGVGRRQLFRWFPTVPASPEGLQAFSICNPACIQGGISKSQGKEPEPQG